MAKARYATVFVPKDSTERPQLTAVPPRSTEATPEALDVTPSDPVDEPRDATLAVNALLAPKVQAHVTLEQASLADIDLLWDMTRADREGVQVFAGIPFQHSPEVFEWVRRIFVYERAGQALFRCVKQAETVIGFVMLLPITHDDGQTPKGVVHCYLAPQFQGDIASYLPSALDALDREVPGVTLMVITVRDSWERLLRANGFTAQIVLTRPSSSGAADGR